MQDTALYQSLLGLQLPWTVRRANLDVTKGTAWTYGPSTCKTRHGRISSTGENS
jgi:hypothetical protein